MLLRHVSGWSNLGFVRPRSAGFSDGSENLTIRVIALARASSFLASRLLPVWRSTQAGATPAARPAKTLARGEAAVLRQPRVLVVYVPASSVPVLCKSRARPRATARDGRPRRAARCAFSGRRRPRWRAERGIRARPARARSIPTAHAPRRAKWAAPVMIFSCHSGSILSGPAPGGVLNTKTIFFCGTEITTILSLS